MSKEWKIINREEVLGSRWYQVFKETVELPSGRVLDDYYVRDGVKAVLIVPHTADGKFILTKQYKHGARKVVLEFPAGGVDPGEDILSAAKRELREEVGGEAASMRIGPTFFENPTSSRGEIFVVFAEGVDCKYEQDLDENEDIEIVALSNEELLKALDEGQLQVPASTAAGYMALRSLV
jgi:ADP-ribose pyrophosphatase